MKLFEVVPEKFFTLLTGTNKEVYAEAVLEIYNLYKINQIGIEYDVVRDTIQELIETREEAGFEVLEEEDEMHGETEDDIFRMKANAFLRKLVALKWIDVEERNHFTRFIVLPAYTIRMLSTLQELCEERIIEYQSFAFNAYQLLTNEGIKDRPSLAIFQAADVTEQLLEELRLLINNMKSHMEQIMAMKSLQEVLDHHFDTYQTKIIDRSYHRLRTSDHVAKYKNMIIETVQEWQQNADFFTLAVQDALKLDRYENEEAAEADVRTALQFIEVTFTSLDDLYTQIDYRHHQYIKSSYDRARYLTQHDQGIQHQIARLLEAYSTGEDENLESVGTLFRLHKIELLAEESLFVPRKRRAPHEAPIHKTVTITEELRQQIAQENRERLEKAITKKTINTFVQKRLKGRKEMDISDLAPTTLEEYLYLPYVYLYGYDKKADYFLVPTETNAIVQIGEYQFDHRKVIQIKSTEGEG
ncbi:DUF5716 family protein [Chryseomicrobium palamuruense]